MAGMGESPPCHTDKKLLWRCLRTAAPGTKADLQSNAECTRHVKGLPRDGRRAGSRARPRARGNSGGVGHLFPAPTPFQGQRRKAANSLASAPQGPLGQGWQSRVHVGLCSWGGFLGEDRSGPPNRCPQGRPLQGGPWRTTRGTEGHRDRCVLGGPMSPGPWDPVGSWALHTLPGLPQLGARGVRAQRCSQALVSRGQQNGHLCAPRPAVPLSAAQSPRDKKEKRPGCHLISLLRVTAQ